MQVIQSVHIQWLEELLANAKKHGIEVHGYTEETWNEEISKNKEHFRSSDKAYIGRSKSFFYWFCLANCVSCS